jgi:predicted transglutaminase-like cysteine proteinase
MKQFVLGSAFLIFISSLPSGASNDHAISVGPAKIEPQKVAFLQSFGDTLPPIGYVNFCREHQANCQPEAKFADRVQLTGAKFRELEQVNDQINISIQPVTDIDLYGKVEYWTYPTHNKGDCEDYVLLKQRILIERGWPESTLLITVVRDENNEGHAVLTVRTDHGDLVLDNKREEIVTWTKTGYTFIKQQSERNPLVWISLVAPDQSTPAAVATSHSN